MIRGAYQGAARPSSTFNLKLQWAKTNIWTVVDGLWDKVERIRLHRVGRSKEINNSPPSTVRPFFHIKRLSNGQQVATPLVSKRSLSVCKLMRKLLYFSLEFQVFLNTS